MVLQKRLDYGFSGYQVPPTPRATRSARRRCSFKKKVDDNQICAFDLLATVAGKLLLEGESSHSSTDTLTGKEHSEVLNDSVKEEQRDEDKSLNADPCYQGGCYRSFYVHELVSLAPVVKHSLSEDPHAQNDPCSGFVSITTTSDCSEKVEAAGKLVIGENKVEPASLISKVDADSPGDCVTFSLEDESKKEVKIEPPNYGKVSVSNRVDMCSFESPVIWYRKPPALVTSDNSVKLPLCGDHVPHCSFPVSRDDVKLAIRDDDENSSGCTKRSTMNKASRPSPRIRDRRIRKLLASKYWKVYSQLNEKNFSAGLEKKVVHCNKKNCSKNQRSLRDYPFKKRKLYDCSSVSNSDGGISSDGMFSSPRKAFIGDGFSLGAVTSGANGTSNTEPNQHASFQSRDSCVKLKIKSFRIPELFVEIPETATVGSLKGTVMEAVTAILGGGLRVGVLLQGKKIRDDNKTLLQTGISRDNKLDALGFSLEPNSSPVPPPVCSEDRHCLLPCDTSQPRKRDPPAPNAVQQGTSDTSPEPQVPNFCNFIESDHDSAPSPPEISPPEMSLDKKATDSRALVAVPPMNVEAVTAVPMQKSKRSEAVQRRIRRPFSVSEVEALVQAVEKLGTGRWRDVKLRAFDNAKHRTYVDLKDKWKTLVHTARISPQQRRGEPVPQGLLDRVITAHSYWSQQQAKQQLKQQPETCFLL